MSDVSNDGHDSDTNNAIKVVDIDSFSDTYSVQKCEGYIPLNISLKMYFFYPRIPIPNWMKSIQNNGQRQESRIPR